MESLIPAHIPRIDGIAHYYKGDRPTSCGINYNRTDWREQEAFKERQYEANPGLNHYWLRSLPFPVFSFETTFQSKGFALGHNFCSMLSDLHIASGMKVLDLAAGSCWTSSRFANLGCQVVATDQRTIKYYGLRSAEAFFEVGNYFERLCCNSFNDLPFDDNTFDIVFCQNAFQYTKDLETAYKEIKRVLKPGGRLVLCWTGVTTPWKSKKYGVGFRYRDYISCAKEAGFGVNSSIPESLFASIKYIAEKRSSLVRASAYIVDFVWKFDLMRTGIRRVKYLLSDYVGIPFNMVATKDSI